MKVSWWRQLLCPTRTRLPLEWVTLNSRIPHGWTSRSVTGTKMSMAPPDADAAIAHNMQCSALLERVPEIAEMTSAHLHGILGPDLTAWIADHPQAHAHPPMRHLDVAAPEEMEHVSNALRAAQAR